MNIKHTPCITDHEVISRLIEDQNEIKLMKKDGHQVISMVSWQSPTTFECHCIPIFSSDKLEDICNRYYDYWPKECLQAIKDIEIRNQNLNSGNAMSKGGNLRAFSSIPVGLQKMLDIWAGGDFISSDGKILRKNIERLVGYMTKLKIGTPYGKRTFGYTPKN